MMERLFEIIELSKPGDTASRVYDIIMMVAISLSMIPLAFKNSCTLFTIIDSVTVCIFIVDYLLRIITADKKMQRGAVSFVLYPFTFMALVDMISILPSFSPLASGFRLFKVLRLFRTLRVFRAFKAFRYSKSIDIILDVIRSQRAPLIAVCTLAVGYVLISALVIFNVEPETFESIFDAIYWATVSLTTMGYGDIYPVTTIGRVVTMVSSFVGIAIVALPAGIITAGYMDKINHLD